MESIRQLSVTAADGCRISFTQQGVGPNTLLLVHGFGENGYSWTELPARMISSWSVLSIDLRGHGDSLWDPNADYRIDKLVSDLASLLDQLEIESFCIAGHSLGANLALHLATLRPRDVRRLVLIEMDINPISHEMLEVIIEQFNAQFRHYNSPDRYYALLEAQRPTADPAALLRYARHSLRPRPGGGYELKCDPRLQSLHQDLLDPSRSNRKRQELSSLNCPVLLVRGEGSAIVTRAAAQKATALVPGAEFTSVPGAGHSVMLDRPNDFVGILARFLEPNRAL